MLPVVAIVGRPNVGKSTLFNRLTRSRDALVADAPGLTRDRKYGTASADDRPYLVVDTGGLGDGEDPLSEQITRQSLQAAREADAVVLLVDGRQGLNAADQDVATQLRAMGKPVLVAVNKAEGLDEATVCAEFHALGLGSPLAISAAHGDGVGALEVALLQVLPQGPEDAVDDDPKAIRVAVLGRPNVGKSTLVNRMLGEERVVTFDEPGTTRDSIAIPFERDGQRYVLIDTAGVRRRGRVTESIERFSVIKTLQALESTQVVVLVMDGHEGITEQDASLLGLILESGRALIIAVNKWDGLAADERERIRSEVQRRLSFADFAPVHYISALHGSGVGDLFAVVRAAHRSAFAAASTAALTRTLAQAVEAHPPPLVRGRRIRLRYAHLGGHNPPTVIIHGNQVTAVPEGYRRYLEHRFIEALNLTGSPVRVIFRQGENPFQGRRNPLTPRQKAKRKRLLRHVKGRR